MTPCCGPPTRSSASWVCLQALDHRYGPESALTGVNGSQALRHAAAARQLQQSTCSTPAVQWRARQPERHVFQRHSAANPTAGRLRGSTLQQLCCHAGDQRAEEMVARAASAAEASTSGQNPSPGGSAPWGPTPASANGAEPREGAATPTMVCCHLDGSRSAAA